MLHMDEEAYNNLVEMNNNHELIDFTIKDQNWSEEKIQAFKDRIRETVEEIDRMKIKAEKYLEKMYEKGDVRRNFFLKAEDYDKIEDIKEIAWNPSLSYFGIEDPNYLYGDKDFTSNVAISPEEAKRAMSETNELRNIQRQRLGNMTGKYHSIVSSKVTKVS